MLKKILIIGGLLGLMYGTLEFLNRDSTSVANAFQAACETEITSRLKFSASYIFHERSEMDISPANYNDFFGPEGSLERDSVPKSEMKGLFIIADPQIYSAVFQFEGDGKWQKSECYFVLSEGQKLEYVLNPLFGGVRVNGLSHDDYREIRINEIMENLNRLRSTN